MHATTNHGPDVDPIFNPRVLIPFPIILPRKKNKNPRWTSGDGEFKTSSSFHRIHFERSLFIHVVAAAAVLLSSSEGSVRIANGRRGGPVP